MPDLKTIDVSALKSVFPVDPQGDASAMIDAGRTIRRKVDRRRTVTIRNGTRAAEQIGKLPGPGEVLHMILRANAFSCYDVLPAVLSLKGQPAKAVLLTSLGINERHLEHLDELANAKQIKNVTLVLSHYFRGVDSDCYAQAQDVCQRHGFHVAAVRSHCKIIAVKFADCCYVATGSGNLRSCRSCENMDLAHDDGTLWKFYAKFAADMLRGAK